MIDIRELALIESDLPEMLAGDESLERVIALFELRSNKGVPRVGANTVHLPPVLDKSIGLYLQELSAARIEHPNPGHLDLVY
jgi:hypothetical protein